MVSLLNKFVCLTIKSIKNRPGAVWHRALVTAESPTGLQLEWDVWEFKSDKRMLRHRTEAVPKSAITKLKTYRE